MQLRDKIFNTQRINWEINVIASAQKGGSAYWFFLIGTNSLQKVGKKSNKQKIDQKKKRKHSMK